MVSQDRENYPLESNNTWLKGAKFAWFAMLGLTLVILFAALPGYLSGFPFDSNRQILATPQLIFLAQVVSSLVSLSSGILCVGLAILLYVRKKQDQMAFYISFYLLIYAMVMTGMLESVLYYWGLSPSIAFSIQTIFSTIPTIFLLSTFPNGRLVPPWTKWLLFSSILVFFLFVIRPAEEWITFSTPYTQVTALILGITVLLAMVAQIYRYRRVSTFTEREQTKWVVAGLFVWIFYMALSSAPWLILQNLPPGQPLPWWVPITSVNWWLSLVIVPLSLSIAILRYRLFDIDIIIRKTLIYGALTITLALVYVGGVVLLQSLFASIGGQQSPVAIVISTLLSAALFNPLRIRVQNFIDRRFYRSKYNSQHAVAEFSIVARNETDLYTLSDELVEVTQEAIQPAFLSLWMSNLENNE